MIELTDWVMLEEEEEATIEFPSSS